MASKLDKILDIKLYYATVSDDREGDQVTVIGYIPSLGRAISLQKAKASQMQEGRSAFGALDPLVEEDFIKRVDPERHHLMKQQVEAAKRIRDEEKAKRANKE